MGLTCRVSENVRRLDRFQDYPHDHHLGKLKIGPDVPAPKGAPKLSSLRIRRRPAPG
jgi:hypothetical protein